MTYWSLFRSPREEAVINYGRQLSGICGNALAAEVNMGRVIIYYNVDSNRLDRYILSCMILSFGPVAVVLLTYLHSSESN